MLVRNSMMMLLTPEQVKAEFDMEEIFIALAHSNVEAMQMGVPKFPMGKMLVWKTSIPAIQMIEGLEKNHPVWNPA